MTYARIYSKGGSLTVHASDTPITMFVLDRTGMDVFDVTFDGAYTPSGVLLPKLSVVDRQVISTGPAIISQVRL